MLTKAGLLLLVECCRVFCSRLSERDKLWNFLEIFLVLRKFTPSLHPGLFQQRNS